MTRGRAAAGAALSPALLGALLGALLVVACATDRIVEVGGAPSDARPSDARPSDAGAGADAGGRADDAVGSDTDDATDGGLRDGGAVHDGRARADQTDGPGDAVEADGGPAPDAGGSDVAPRDIGPSDASPGDGEDAADRDVVDPPPRDVARDGAPPVLCAGDDDDRIVAAEMPVDPRAGVSVLHSVNLPGTTVTVPDLAGSWRDGTLEWDFTGFDEDRDHVVQDVLLPPEDHWFGEAFPEADWAGAVDAGGDVLGLYRLDEADGSVALLGMASVAEGETLLRYETPIRLYRFPIEHGDTYASLEVEVTGRFDGIDYPYGTLRLVHDYRFAVDRVGIVHVPAGSFRALRIAAEVEARAENLGVPVGVERSRIYFFLAECAGLVARVRSEEGEARPDFDRATEYRRLGFPL